MKVLITGGAGFIGINAASRYLARGDQVIIVDNLSRPGTEANLRWLQHQGGSFKSMQTDLRDSKAVETTFRDCRDVALVLHLAGQVAVTTSVADPRSDFEMNALGTLNVLEAMRRNKLASTLIYSSTNKVYGDLAHVQIAERPERYEYADMPHGVHEDIGLDFHSPYGCSKGSADQYVRDYHRIFGLNTVVFRQSCIYGTRQFGMEDQGWIAWFLIAAELGLPLTIYGDGKQVRDVLFVDDLLNAFDAAAKNIEVTRGRVYNIGGGPGNAISILELIDHVSALSGKKLPYRHGAWRLGDQRIYVSDIRRAKSELGWEPAVPWQRGVEAVRNWVLANRAECEAASEAVARKLAS
jgi:CDP-paratose 2-epimerase